MRKNEEQGVSMIRFVSSIFVGGVIALAICLILLFICSVGISGGWINERHMTQYTFAVCIFGTFAGGIYAIARYGSKRLVVGMSAGIMHFFLMLAAGLLTYKSISFENHGIGWICACLIGGALASFAGVKTRKKKRK